MRDRLARLQPVGLLTALWPYVRPERRRLVLHGQSAAVGVPGLAPERLWLLGLLVAAGLARGILLAAQGALAGATGERVAARLRQALWGHLQRLPLEYTERRGPGRLLLRFTSDARAVQRFVAEGLVR